MKIVHGTEVLTTVEEWIDPKRTALVVIDMQNEIVCEQGGYGPTRHRHIANQSYSSEHPETA